MRVVPDEPSDAWVDSVEKNAKLARKQRGRKWLADKVATWVRSGGGLQSRSQRRHLQNFQTRMRFPQ
jgi:hypothetical protein